MCGLSLLTSPPRSPIVTDQERFKAIGLIYPLFLDSKQMFCSLPVLQNSCESMYFRWSCNHIKTAELKSDLDDFKWGSSSLSLNRWPKTEMQWMQTLKTPGWWYVCIVVVEQCGVSTSLFFLLDIILILFSTGAWVDQGHCDIQLWRHVIWNCWLSFIHSLTVHICVSPTGGSVAVHNDACSYFVAT